ncbi:hypothetical protein RF11_15597 [Thelohanellus kitauei]|uniref:Uncharacterized protein n=1 Tax=Thelohanellus kitauei TaxID=669202 RepID=A0A0C2NC19_THEKT|nr:hypothetical protein RF11_15596 [Thelohanellus kitauei]KII73896.1 hypothetical protein RF11_15597 [Thelohanellus kitauei]
MEKESVYQGPMNGDILKCHGKRSKKCNCLVYFVNQATWNGIKLAGPHEAHSFLENVRLKAEQLLYLQRPFDSQDTNGTDLMFTTKICRKSVSEQYVEFVRHIREQLLHHGLCEAACKKILLYTDDIYNRILKNEGENTNDANPAAKGKPRQKTILKTLDELKTVSCCQDNCTNKISQNQDYYQSLRDKARESRKMKRWAATALLNTPSRETANCEKFIMFVIGLCKATLKSVKENNDAQKDHLHDKNEEINIEKTDKNLATTSAIAKNSPVQMAKTSIRSTAASPKYKGTDTNAQAIPPSSLGCSNQVNTANHAKPSFHKSNKVKALHPKTLKNVEPRQRQFKDMTIQNDTINTYSYAVNDKLKNIFRVVLWLPILIVTILFSLIRWLVLLLIQIITGVIWSLTMFIIEIISDVILYLPILIIQIIFQVLLWLPMFLIRILFGVIRFLAMMIQATLQAVFFSEVGGHEY